MTTDPARIGEASRLADLEKVVERGLSTFVEVGEALLAIRDERLYRLTHGTWEAYLSDRWGFSDGRWRQIKAATEVAHALSVTTGSAPTSERVARELVPIMRQDPVSLPVVMAAAQERAGERPVTAADVRAEVRERFRSMAAESEAEVQQATSHWTPDQRAAVAPERMRQQGELMRLTADLSRLPDPVEYAHEHRDLPARVIDQAEQAHAWLSDFLSEWRHQ